MQTAIETKVNQLAAEVIPAAHLASFLALPLEAKLTGIAVFAHVAGEGEVKENCLQAIRLLKN